MTVAQQRRYEKAAAILLYLVFLVNLVADYALGRGYFAPTHTWTQLATLYLATPLTWWIYYHIYKGTRGAKTFVLVCYAIGAVNLFSDGIRPAAYDTPLELGNLVGQYGLGLLACGLLLLSLRTPVDATVSY